MWKIDISHTYYYYSKMHCYYFALTLNILDPFKIHNFNT